MSKASSPAIRCLANVSFYWFTRRDRIVLLHLLLPPPHRPWMIPDGAAVTAADGLRPNFQRRCCIPPRSLAEPMFTNIRRWTVMKKGGHFAAMEQPDALAEDVRAFYRALRS